ncbi:carotenoid ester lipase precursor [Obba rivulosa]|uniref:Carotenoid ester lipase n=1 Tax=Obba rivulosa TaxID=1052685 RepID=A0A8E2DNK1_9APHY|nr:carotenoid ester lipase precursor [Obba rivulosa]
MWTIATLLSLVISAALCSGVAPPTVVLDNGTFIGEQNGTTDRFLGIPFAKPPTGSLRFSLPQLPDSYSGVYNATAFGFSCPGVGSPANVTNDLQALLDDVMLPQTPIDEDCLTLNIWAPHGVKAGADLPVVAWIYGGGFYYGGSSRFDGSKIVKRSIELEEPIVYVSMNYRLAALGFLASQEVTDAGVANLGLRDQREALRWIQKYIKAFGGDPKKVAMWGESSGANSVMFQMVTNGGDPEGLFRGAFIESGAPLPLANYTAGQASYNALVNATNCTSAADTLDCLRQVPFDALFAAINTPPWFEGPLPLVDGDFLADSPPTLVRTGRIAKVPYVNGNCDDEGTEFVFASNIENVSEVISSINGSYLKGITTSEVTQILDLYSSNVTLGSPYGTGTNDVLTPEYKRMASIVGDLDFHGPRRSLLEQTSHKQPAWAFLSKRYKSLPIIGAGHETDILNVYGPGDLTDFLVNFVNHLNPNNKTGVKWPQWTSETPLLLTFWDGDVPLNITEDNFRIKGMKLLTDLGQKYPLSPVFT